MVKLVPAVQVVGLETLTSSKTLRMPKINSHFVSERKVTDVEARTEELCLQGPAQNGTVTRFIVPEVSKRGLVETPTNISCITMPH